MGLLEDQIQARLEKPKKEWVLQKAKNHENHLKFHTESYMSPGDIQAQVTIFLDWVRNILKADDAYRTFVSLFRFPSPTVELTNSIFSELERVFEPKNPAISQDFIDPYYKEDWERFQKNNIPTLNIMKTKGWDKVKTSINTVVVVDVAKTQDSDFAKPYFYFLDIENVIDYSYQDDKITDIIFKTGEFEVAMFNDIGYYLFEVNEDNKVVALTHSVEHNLGYCPADFLWDTPLNQKYPDLKKSPISSQLANLDWLLFFSISKRHLDLHAPYPIYSGFESDCDFENNETGEYCDGGFLRNTADQYVLLRDNSVAPCPACAQKKLVGPGAFIEVPVPEKDGPDLRKPIDITTVDKGSLDYNVEEVQRLKESIFGSVTGFGGDVQLRQSVNEKQIQASLESKISVLNSLKVNIEKAVKFIDDTMCRLRYGPAFVRSSVSLGTEWYVFTLEDLQKQYDSAKKAGASYAQLDIINEQIIATEYKNNPPLLHRMLLLKHLEPYRHHTLKELLDLRKENLLNEIYFLIKINFTTFVDRFERENMNILEFGSQISFDKKISVIFEKFKTYANGNKENSG